MNTGEPVAGIEVASQRTDKTEDRWWVTYWHPLRDPKGEIIGVNVAAEEITERKRAEAVLAANDKALRESELRFRELADNISQFAWTADASGWIYWYNKRWHGRSTRCDQHNTSTIIHTIGSSLIQSGQSSARLREFVS